MAALLSLTLLLLVVGGHARSEGPPLTACPTMMPNHQSNVGQTSPSPVIISISPDDPYDVDNLILITLTANRSDISGFRGFMIQARPVGEDTTIGTFESLSNPLAQTITCSATNDTAAHFNPARDEIDTISVRWKAPSTSDELKPFNFYYTVVKNFTTFWVMQASVTIQVQVDHSNTSRTSGGYQCKRRHSSADNPNLNLVRAHGALMTVAWGLLAPAGILLALFYKVVWPNGEWFYAHIVIMCSAIVMTLAGIVVIVVHAGGKWLTSTDVNPYHQALGIVATAAVGINPLLALGRCQPDSRWRWIYNWTHGSIGLILGQICAFCAMLLGLYVFRELVSDCNHVHTAIHTASSLVGVFGFILVMYNLYATSYRKLEPRPKQETDDQHSEDDEVLQPSRDHWMRTVVGIVLIVIQVALTSTTIAYIVLAEED